MAHCINDKPRENVEYHQREKGQPLQLGQLILETDIIAAIHPTWPAGTKPAHVGAFAQFPRQYSQNKQPEVFVYENNESNQVNTSITFEKSSC